jgi:UDP-2,4-diacetamido-2,4,6-trideoxy-beta-L-altropyranose hydrolase
MDRPARVVFRADASLTIGQGHVMRCLALAEALRRRGASVSFICRTHDGHLCEVIEARGFGVHRMPVRDQVPITPGDDRGYETWLGAPWSNDAGEVASMIGALKDVPDWLVADHYAIDHRWESALRGSVERIMVIEDLDDRVHDCDLLLDQNLIPGAQRHARHVPEASGVMLGPTYALLAPVYAELHERVPAREGPVRRLLFYFGGADNVDLMGRSLRAFLQLDRPDIAADIVIAPGHPNATQIRTLADSQPNIRVHTDLPTLAPLIAQADLAIGAGGATNWERLCLGLPSLIVTLADNQRPIAESLDARGLVRWLGHHDTVDEAALSSSLASIIDGGLDESWSSRCLTVVDGEGVRRVCEALLATESTPLRARPSRRVDALDGAMWVPDAKGVSAQDCLRDIEGCRPFVVETLDGTAVAQVCFRRAGEDWWDILRFSASEFRGTGIDRSATATALSELRVREPGSLGFRSGAPLASSQEEAAPEGWKISVCTGADSWINETVAGMTLEWVRCGHSVRWVHDASLLDAGDMCFYLGYGRIVDAETLQRHANNMVVHASDLPRGRGWSPLTWQILEGKNRIPVSLFEAAETVDSGSIYKQVEVRFTGGELIDDLRRSVGDATRDLCDYFVRSYPDVVRTGRAQDGDPTFYARRREADSRIEVDRTIREQFALLRTVDSERYPAWFEIDGNRYTLKIERMGAQDS